MLSPAPSAPPGYQLQQELGRGGMGVVYRALHLPTGAARAVKLMIGPIELEALERLRREGAALARVGGAGLVPVHEAGEHAGRAYLVLGLMEGGSLRERLRAGGRFRWEEAAALLAPLARALARCHAAGLVHRDLKPDNVLFDAEGRPHLADFGCVRDLGLTSLTASGMTLGTLIYMAPEQLDRSRVEPPADVYSLGVILHELVAGAPPIDRSLTPLALMREKVAPTRPRARLEALAGALPALDDLVDRAMAYDPAARPDATAFASALEALVSGESLPAVNRPPRRRRGIALAAGAGALLAGALALGVGRGAWDAGDLGATEGGSAESASQVGPARPRRSTRVPPRSGPEGAAVKELTHELWGKEPLEDLASLVERAKAEARRGAPAEALRRLRGAARERFENAVEIDLEAPGPDLERAADDALRALLLVHWIGQYLEQEPPDLELERLTKLLEEVPRGPDHPVSLATLERVRQVVSAYRPGHMVNTVADIAENAANAGHVESAAAALSEAIEVNGDEPKPRIKLGVLLTKQALGGEVDARFQQAAEVLDGALALARTKSEHEMSTMVLARAALYAQAGDAERGLALLDAEERVLAVQEAFERVPGTKAAALVLRARLELLRGEVAAAARALRDGAALEGLDPGQAARLASLAERCEGSATPAELKEVAAELARWPLPL